MRKIPDKKLKIVQEFKDLVKTNPIIGIVNMENLPAKQLQNMREQLRDMVVIKMTKKRLIKIALDSAKADKAGIEKLLDRLRGMPAMIFTKDNPFTLYKKLDANKSSAPAKAGQTANNDIIIPAGPTPFSPGPIIGELGALKIKAGIENGKVAIKEDSLVVKEGEQISAEIAGILTRLGIEPMEIGLDIVAVYENGEIYAKDVLAIDEDKYVADLKSAGIDAFSLAISIGYATSDTIKMMLQKAYSDAKAVGLSQSIEADDILKILIAQAESEMNGLKSQLNLPDAEKSEAEKPAEPVKAEAPEETQEADKPTDEAKVEEPAPVQDAKTSEEAEPAKEEVEPEAQKPVEDSEQAKPEEPEKDPKSSEEAEPKQDIEESSEKPEEPKETEEPAQEKPVKDAKPTE